METVSSYMQVNILSFNQHNRGPKTFQRGFELDSARSIPGDMVTCRSKSYGSENVD